jgi:translation initiation factor IF-1
VDVLPKSLFRVELPNGHRVLGHLSKRLRGDGTGLAGGDTVMLEMTPYDLSKGRIVGKTQNLLQ